MSSRLIWTYIYAQRLPNSFANSGAVMNLCKGFADNGDAVRIAWAGRRDDEKAIRAYYGIPGQIAMTPLPRAHGPFYYPVMACTAVLRSRTGILITRIPQVAVLAAVMRKPAILELHQHLPTFSNWRYWRKTISLVPAGMLAVATLTDALAAQLDPDMARVAAAVQTIASAAPDFGDVVDNPIHDVGYAGSFMPGKGIEHVCDLAESLPDIRFIIYGDPASAPDVTNKLSALPNVTLGGFVSPRDIGPALKSFRIGLAPYASTGFGAPGAATVSMDSMSSLKIIEYMSAERAIIASRMPSVEAVVSDGESALLCDPGNLVAWRQNILRLMADPALTGALGKKARQNYLEKHDYRARAHAFAQLASHLAL